MWWFYLLVVDNHKWCQFPYLSSSWIDLLFFFHTAVLEYFLIALTRIWNFFCILITSFRVSLSSRSSPLDENCTETLRNALLSLKNSQDWNFLCISFLRCPLYYSVYEIGCYISNNGLKLFRKKKLRAIPTFLSTRRE